MGESKANILKKAIKVHYQSQSLELEEYLLKKREKLHSETEFTFSDLFSTLEHSQLNMAATRQVHLSETIEMIGGISVPETIRRYRGLILNLEKIMMLFKLFTDMFQFFSYTKAKNIAFSGYSDSQATMEKLWNQNTLIELTRPSEILKEIPIEIVPKIKNIIQGQQKKAWRIAKIIDKDSKIKNVLNNINVSISDEKDILDMTGPIIRAIQNNQSHNTLNIRLIRKSASFFLQEAYTYGQNLWHPFRVCYTELLLAIGRALLLLRPYPIYSSNDRQKPINGESSSAFPTPLGNSYLTINLSKDSITYFNYIPPEMVNYTGIRMLLSINTGNVHPLILLFLDPEITLDE